MGKKRYIYLATNGDTYEWNAYAAFTSKADAERYVAMFAFPEKVERWEVPELPDDHNVTAWTCRFDWDGNAMTCHSGALSHDHIGHIDGWKWGNRGTAVYARNEQEAYDKALAIIEAMDGPRDTWGDPQRNR